MKILVVDIGGTSIKYACMREDMTMLTRGKIPTPKEGREELIEAIGKLYDGLPDVEGIAISMPGIIDSAGGYCVMGGALRYNDDFYLRHSLYKRCPVKIYMENDAKCAAMAEAAAVSYTHLDVYKRQQVLSMCSYNFNVAVRISINPGALISIISYF